MLDVTDRMRFEGVAVDIAFGEPRPEFGDLCYLLCGESYPLFPPSAPTGFGSMADFEFGQIDDYFGVLAPDNAGDEVFIWLYPLVGIEPVSHHPGPFDGVRLSYNVLRHPAHRAGRFLQIVDAFADLGVGVYYRCRGVELGSPPDLSPLRMDIEAIVQHWASEGVAVGSVVALEVDY